MNHFRITKEWATACGQWFDNYFHVIVYSIWHFFTSNEFIEFPKSQNSTTMNLV